MRQSSANNAIPSEVLLPTLHDGNAGKRGQRQAAPTTYYGQPMVKKPTWKWPIPLYFFLGGVAGGAAVIGTAADLLGGEKHRATVRHARYLTLVLSLICPLLLIQDLGRPTRFHRMLRVFKVSSPLSVGTWILSVFGATSGVLAARQAAEDNIMLRRDSRLGRLARLLPAGPFAVLQGLLGLGLGGYTGVLLAITAVPLWAAAGILLGPLFLATSLASGASALVLIRIFSGNNDEEARSQIEAVETISAVTQLGLVAAREVLVPAKIAKPLRSGLWGRLFQVGAVGAGMGGPLVLRLAMRLSGQRVGRALSATVSTLSLVGALIERFAITEAGKRSADDPLAYQELTKAAPGEARPTPKEQAQRAPQVPAYRPHVVAPERTS